MFSNDAAAPNREDTVVAFQPNWQRPQRLPLGFCYWLPEPSAGTGKVTARRASYEQAVADDPASIADAAPQLPSADYIYCSMMMKSLLGSIGHCSTSSALGRTTAQTAAASGTAPAASVYSQAAATL